MRHRHENCIKYKYILIKLNGKLVNTFQILGYVQSNQRCQDQKSRFGS